MSDKPTYADLRPAIYAHRLADVQSLAYQCGYAIAVHGTMIKDFDLVAIPWTDEAVSAEELVRKLVMVMKGQYQEGDPVSRPHGRLTWSLILESCNYIDLSVMPRS